MLSKDELYRVTEKYFQAFEMKNIEYISNLFAPDILLKDPVVKEVKGQAAVVEVYRTIFKNCFHITIEKISIYVDCFLSTTIGEVKFYCGEAIIEVVDIIEYTPEGKIRGITAYLDRNKDN